MELDFLRVQMRDFCTRIQKHAQDADSRNAISQTVMQTENHSCATVLQTPDKGNVPQRVPPIHY